jgi:hypothetical protein
MDASRRRIGWCVSLRPPAQGDFFFISIATLFLLPYSRNFLFYLFSKSLSLLVDSLCFVPLNFSSFGFLNGQC